MNDFSFIVIIPARYNSSRLPGKVLLDIAGKPMIQHVYERACQSGAAEVIIATDDDRIKQSVMHFGSRVCMTALTHRSGTERIAEVVEQLGLDSQQIIVNVQGDEPLINPTHICQVAHNLKMNSTAQVATLCEPIVLEEQVFNPNIVKVIFDQQHFALYFSRAPIPWMNSENRSGRLNHFRHIGIYAYSAGFIKNYVCLPITPLEQMESLEQLRVLWYGYKIHVETVKAGNLPGVDTANDLRAVREYFVYNSSCS